MNRTLCICLSFLSPAHIRQITETAEAAGFTPRFFTDKASCEASGCLETCEVLYAQYPELLSQTSTALKWLCIPSAGAEVYCKDETMFPNPDCVLTNSAGAYGVTISEHIIMMLLILLRRMPVYLKGTAAHAWTPSMEMRSIQGSRITCLGTGDICSTFARKAKALGAVSVTGVNHSGRLVEGFDAITTTDHLDDVLPDTHILVMALPYTAETVGILSRERLALLPQDALIVNVGRGSAIDQAALVDALNAERIAGAALDVTTPEPLPVDDPLWTAKNLVLTPHISGNMSLGYTRDKTVSMFCENLTRYAAGEPLQHVVDRKRGY